MASPNRTEQPPLADITSAELAAIKLEFQDRHYRQTLPNRISALGNKTPRQALRTENSRQSVIAWLKYLGNGEARRAAQSGEAPYDFSWMWKELGHAQEQLD